MNKSLIADATESKSWPFEEARKIIKRLEKNKKDIVFETGYGPSGLPHIGTFGEVARTSMVRFALKTLDSSIESKIICFSDDMDGLRKVPDNIPNQKVLEDNLEKPLSTIPDPYGKYKSYAEHNNSLLKDFLNQFGFEYEFMSSTEQYLSGNFDNTLKDIMQNYDAISNIIISASSLIADKLFMIEANSYLATTLISARCGLGRPTSGIHVPTATALILSLAFPKVILGFLTAGCILNSSSSSDNFDNVEIASPASTSCLIIEIRSTSFFVKPRCVPFIRMGSTTPYLFSQTLSVAMLTPVIFEAAPILYKLVSLVMF